jgi:hypothetical protein
MMMHGLANFKSAYPVPNKIAIYNYEGARGDAVG